MGIQPPVELFDVCRVRSVDVLHVLRGRRVLVAHDSSRYGLVSVMSQSSASQCVSVPCCHPSIHAAACASRTTGANWAAWWAANVPSSSASSDPNQSSQPMQPIAGSSASMLLASYHWCSASTAAIFSASLIGGLDSQRDQDAPLGSVEDFLDVVGVDEIVPRLHLLGVQNLRLREVEDAGDLLGAHWSLPSRAWISLARISGTLSQSLVR